MRLFLHRVAHGLLTYMLGYLAYIWLFHKGVFDEKSYTMFAHFNTQQHWGIAAFVLACFGLLTWSVTNWQIRTFAAGVLAAAHLAVALSFMLGDGDGAAPGAYLGYAILGTALAYSTAHLNARRQKGVEFDDTAGQLAGGGMCRLLRRDRVVSNSPRKP